MVSFQFSNVTLHKKSNFAKLLSGNVCAREDEALAATPLHRFHEFDIAAPNTNTPRTKELVGNHEGINGTAVFWFVAMMRERKGRKKNKEGNATYTSHARLTCL